MRGLEYLLSVGMTRRSLLVLLLGLWSLIGCASANADEGGSVPDSLTLSGMVVLVNPWLCRPMPC